MLLCFRDPILGQHDQNGNQHDLHDDARDSIDNSTALPNVSAIGRT